MALRSGPTDWSTPIKILHWLLALAVLAMVVFGFVMKYGDFSQVERIRLYNLHKSTGLTVLVLAVLRLLIRLVDRRRPVLPPMPAWQRATAAFTHVFLYVALIGMPLSGWLYNSASGFPLRWFGLFPVPALSGRDSGLKDLAGEIHFALALLLVLVVIVHAGAALTHHFQHRDNVLRSMLPRLRRGAAGALLAAALLPALLVSGTARAQAPSWVPEGEAVLAFRGSYQGEAFEGRFARFTPQVRFDPDDLAGSGIEVDIELASAATGIEDYDGTMQSAEFFDSARFPRARFVAGNLRTEGEGYLADAELTLRDRTVPLAFPFVFEIDGERAVLTAKVTLKRLDFGVGTGEWADTALIANEVEVRVELPLRRAPAP
ncbi:MAG: cytochrome b/b6 domain-containing protein [Xanthomonadales bacterium]|nr:cytochrome b/b6 domain-containing protein [Xanthomonadales bacterium]